MTVNERFAECEWRDSFGCCLGPGSFICRTCGVTVGAHVDRMVHNDWHNVMESRDAKVH